jgi:hypothetical protein
LSASEIGEKVNPVSFPFNSSMMTGLATESSAFFTPFQPTISPEWPGFWGVSRLNSGKEWNRM